MFTCLFLASIGLVISPVFILEHVRLLGVGAVIVLIVKAALISVVVWNFKYSWNTSLAVGFSLAQARIHLRPKQVLTQQSSSAFFGVHA